MKVHQKNFNESPLFTVSSLSAVVSLLNWSAAAAAAALMNHVVLYIVIAVEAGKRKESQDDLADKQLKHILYTSFYKNTVYKNTIY